jgi:hypothetical protein
MGWFSCYSIIVDAATNFRVWSLKVPRGTIALRVTKLRKNRSRRGKPIPPREIEAVGLGRFSSSTSLALFSTSYVNAQTAHCPLSAAPRSLVTDFF